MKMARNADGDEVIPMVVYTIEVDDGDIASNEHVMASLALHRESFETASVRLQKCQRPARVRRGLPHLA